MYVRTCVCVSLKRNGCVDKKKLRDKSFTIIVPENSTRTTRHNQIDTCGHKNIHELCFPQKVLVFQELMYQLIRVPVNTCTSLSQVY